MLNATRVVTTITPFLLVAAGALAADAPSKPLELGSHRELFVDRYLIDRLEGVDLRLHEPQHAGTAIRFDRSYEGVFAAYVTVLHDGETYHMYYRGLRAEKSGIADHSINKEVTCYARSKDGITWEKPDVGLFEVDGNKNNNVIMSHSDACHNFSPFVDGRPGVDPAQRFKALGGNSKTGLLAFVSADGVHWRPLRPEPVITGGAFDSQNVGMWSPAEGCYVCYYRTFKKTAADNYRWITRTTSRDFVTWSEPQDIDFGDAPDEHFYTNQTHPYYRAPQLYVSIFARFMPGRQVLTTQQAKSVGVVGDYYTDCSDACFMTSRGGNRFDRTFLESFVRPGPGLSNWTSRTNYPALGVVPTSDGYMSLYVQRAYAQPDHYLERLTLRPDGFASLHAPYREGRMSSKLLTFTGRTLSLNVATSAAGHLRAELQSPDGKPLPGYSLADCDPVIGDEFDRVVTWKHKSDLSTLAGQPVRLLMVMSDADLYSLQFR